MIVIEPPHDAAPRRSLYDISSLPYKFVQQHLSTRKETWTYNNPSFHLSIFSFDRSYRMWNLFIIVNNLRFPIFFQYLIDGRLALLIFDFLIPGSLGSGRPLTFLFFFLHSFVSGITAALSRPGIATSRYFDLHIRPTRAINVDPPPRNWWICTRALRTYSASKGVRNNTAQATLSDCPAWLCRI